MAKNDPTNTGGLFVGRRPDTAPLRYRRKPVPTSGVRRRVDTVLAAGILLAETAVLLTLWGPQPAGWLWIGAQLDHQTDSLTAGLVVAFIGTMLTMVGTIGLAKRLDHAWKLVRRAAGFEQKEGALNRILVISGAIGVPAFLFWLLIIEGPGSHPGIFFG